MNICPDTSIFRSMPLIFLLSLIASCNCRITSLNNKYSHLQTLHSVETSVDGDALTLPKLPHHNLEKRATSTSNRITPSKILVDSATLYGTEKSNQAFVHWIGKEISEKVIVLTCEFNISSGVRVVVNSKVWRSDDYGKSFSKVENLGSDAKISYFYAFPNNSRKLLFTDVQAKKVYTSSDEATTFSEHNVPVEPDIVLPNPSDEDKILIYSATLKKLYVSHDFAKTWTLLSENVLPKFYWGIVGYDKEDLVHMEVESSTPDKAEYKACISGTGCTDVTSQMGFVGPFMADTLIVHKEFMFVQESTLNGSESYMMVSHKRQPFKMAYFPGNVKTNDFMLLNLDDGEVFVAVTHENQVNLYLSDSTGHYFVLSFSDVYHVVHPYWMEIDLHEVRGMNWTFLVNKRMADVPNGVASFISFDKGGNWGPIPVPEELKKDCGKAKECRLLLNIKQTPFMTPVISSTNAPGIIMAHGTLSSSDSKPNTMSLFTSRDGGWTWKKAPFYGIHTLNILDQGSILTAIPDGLFSRNRSKTLWFSCDEGATWKNELFDNLGFMVNGVLTEPGILTLTETLFGHEGVQQPWILMSLNFSLVLQKKCNDSDYESWFPEDYNDATQNNCTMGRLIEYKRRKQNAACYNGVELIPRVVSKDKCKCTREDYECDFGFDEGQQMNCEKAKWYFEGYLLVECKQGEDYYKSRGYRKVSSDTCDEKDTEKKYGKLKSTCVDMKPHGLSVSTHTLNIPVGQEISFYLTQTGGSIYDTNYTWDFGDATNPKVYHGLEKARNIKYTFTKSGRFKVHVKALNMKGEATAELMVHVQERISDLSMVSPLAAKAGVSIALNVEVSSQLLPFQANTDHVHYIWTFGDEDANSRPLLTWEHSVNHTYKKKGGYTISVEAVNSLGSIYRQYEMQIFDDAAILVMTFEGSGMVNISNPIISRLLLQRMRYQLSDDLGVGLERMEATYSTGEAHVSLLYIYPSNNAKDESIESIEKRVLDLANSGNFGFSLLGKRAEGGLIIKVTSAKPYEPKPDDDHKSHHKGPNMKAIFIGVPVLVLVVLVCIFLLCYYRRKHRNVQQYSMLHIQDDSDPLLDDEDDPPLDLNIEFRGGRESFRDDPVIDVGGSQLVMQDGGENC